MPYIVKESFLTLQGEGYHSGRVAVFCRFTGCNLWSGHEKDRQKAICSFCDTDFVGTDGEGGGTFDTADLLAEHLINLWPDGKPAPFLVCTGGEPLLQLDSKLIESLHAKGFTIAIESNGTITAPRGIDWICVSPKAGTTLVQTSGDELKLVYPQEGIAPSDYENLEFKHFYLQPMDNVLQQTNLELTVDYCLQHPQWKISIQLHKQLGLP